jgi:hypothetical protein
MGTGVLSFSEAALGRGGREGRFEVKSGTRRTISIRYELMSMNDSMGVIDTHLCDGPVSGKNQLDVRDKVVDILYPLYLPSRLFHTRLDSGVDGTLDHVRIITSRLSVFFSHHSIGGVGLILLRLSGQMNNSCGITSALYSMYYLED